MNLIKQDLVWKSLQGLVLGAVTPLAFSPYDIHVVAIVTIALIIHLWSRSSFRAVLLSGYCYGLGMFGVGISWLHISINLFGGVNLAGSTILTALFVAFIALFPALAGYLSASLSRKNYPAVSVLLLFPAVWTLIEWLRSWIFTGFPWLNLGYSQTDSLLRGMAPLTGVFGVSFAVVASAGAIVVLVRSKRPGQYGMATLILLLWASSWTSAKIEWTRPIGEEISVALIQGSVPQDIKWQPSMRQPTLDLYRDLTLPYLDHDLVIWPEAAIPAFYDQVEDYIKNLLVVVGENNTNLITGIPVRHQASGKYFNSVVMLNHDVRFYYKRHLVPFGEYLPLEFILGGIVDYLQIPVSDFSSGPADTPLLSAGDFDIGVSICYEDTFGEEVIQALPQAAILVNVSNDAWFGDSAAPHQHLQMARMRALESGRYLLRATNTGITAIIDEKGDVLTQSPQFAPFALSGKATLFHGSTPYVRFGNYPITLLSLLIMAFFVYKRITDQAAIKRAPPA